MLGRETILNVLNTITEAWLVPCLVEGFLSRPRTGYIAPRPANNKDVIMRMLDATSTSPKSQLFGKVAAAIIFGAGDLSGAL